MKKIIHIINGLNLGGAETALYRLLQNMHGQHVFYIIVLSKPGYYSEPINKLDIPIHYLYIGQTNLVITCYRLIALIQKINPDIVQTWLYHSDFIGGLCAKLCGVKKIIWSIRCEGVNLKRATNWVKRGCAFLSWMIPSFIINNSQSARQHHIQNGYHAKKMRVIYNGFDTQLFAPTNLTYAISPTLPDNALLLGTLARFHEDKGYLNLIKVIDTICARHANAYFVLCGQDCHVYNVKLTGMLETLIYRDRVLLVGKTDNAVIYLNQLDIFILPSNTESFPNCLAEAMACGVACIATDVGETRNLLSDTGIIVPPNNPDQLASACLSMLAKSQEERKQSGLAARDRIKEYYSLAAHIDQMQSLYDL